MLTHYCFDKNQRKILKHFFPCPDAVWNSAVYMHTDEEKINDFPIRNESDVKLNLYIFLSIRSNCKNEEPKKHSTNIRLRSSLILNSWCRWYLLSLHVTKNTLLIARLSVSFILQSELALIVQTSVCYKRKFNTKRFEKSIARHLQNQSKNRSQIARNTTKKSSIHVIIYIPSSASLEDIPLL